MDETKYDKYFISAFKEEKGRAYWDRDLKTKDELHLLRIDEEVIKGIHCFARCNWFWPSLVNNDLKARSTTPHSHKYDEIIGLIGTDFDNPTELRGEVEINMGGEKHIVTKSTLIFIPAGLEHGPFRELKMERPIFQFEFAMNGKPE